MAVIERRTTDTITERADNERVVSRSNDANDSALTLARIIYFIGGIITALLTFRIILSLLGANRDNSFAYFIYQITYPFVAPFFGLFNYKQQYGVVRFEFETLIAIGFWAFVTWMLVKLVTIFTNKSDAEV